MISLVIPTIGRDTLLQTIQSATRQSLKPSEIHVIYDHKKLGAPHARNRGSRASQSPYLFFCDDDVILSDNALEYLYNAFEGNPTVGFTYGKYRKGDHIIGDNEFNAEHLKKINYISTMSLIRREAFEAVGGWDESIKRLQDWDLWLSMLEKGYVGVYCGQQIFETATNNDGITNGDAQDWHKAVAIVRQKHESSGLLPNPGSPSLHANVPQLS